MISYPVIWRTSGGCYRRGPRHWCRDRAEVWRIWRDRGALRAHRRARIDCQAITKAGGKAEVIPCDVTSLQSVEAAAKAVEVSFGRVDILVNNAGIGGFGGPLHQLPPDAWDQILNTNLRGVYYAIRAFAPMMIRARSGHIINISSLAGKNALPNGAAYAASKWGLNGLSYSVAEELRVHNIRVSVVCPGLDQHGIESA